ncbi:MAG: hypothetical protein ABI401_01085 [Candidatus Dormibacter sp.]
MSLEVRIASRVVEEDFPNLPLEVQKDLLGDPDIPEDEGKVGALAENPDLGKPLQGVLRGLRRLSLTGRYRAIYKTFLKKNVVYVILVGIRKEGSASDAHQRAERLLQGASLKEILGAEASALFEAPAAVKKPTAKTRKAAQRGRPRKARDK